MLLFIFLFVFSPCQYIDNVLTCSRAVEDWSTGGNILRYSATHHRSLRVVQSQCSLSTHAVRYWSAAKAHVFAVGTPWEQIGIALTAPWHRRLSKHDVELPRMLSFQKKLHRRLSAMVSQRLCDSSFKHKHHVNHVMMVRSCGQCQIIKTRRRHLATAESP